MRRWHAERHISRRKQLRHLRVAHNWPREPVDCDCELQTGRFRKKDGFCDKPRCMICKYEKVLDLPSYKDILEKSRYEEQLQDYLAV